MVEQWFPKPKVKGSNPFSPDKKNQSISFDPLKISINLFSFVSGGRRKPPIQAKEMNFYIIFNNFWA